MTTTQPTEFTNQAGMRLTIHEDAVVISTPMAALGFQFDPGDTETPHRASLAILTGPGKVDTSQDDGSDGAVLRNVARRMEQHFADLDARAAAEAEAAELEAEAEQLFAVYTKELDWKFTWSSQGERTKRAYRALAREARRLHTNKETRS